MAPVDLSRVRSLAALDDLESAELGADELRELLRLVDEGQALRGTAAAMVDDLESPHGDWPRHCDVPGCRRLATSEDGDQIACDEHQGELVAGDIEDLSYAPALRQLRVLLKGEG